MLRPVAFILLVSVMWTCPASTTQAGVGHEKSAQGAKGIWKSAVPRGGMHGAFDNHDPIGLMNGQFIKADCSINWTNPDSGQLFCFSTPTSMAYFLYWPRRNTARAKVFWEKSAATH